MKFTPLTISIKIIPPIPGKRFENIAALSNAAIIAYNTLKDLPDYQFAIPGGGHNHQISDYTQRSGLGSYVNGTAAKPQIGANPAQLVLTGFYRSALSNIQTYEEHTIFAGGSTYTSTAKTRITAPDSTIDDEVKTIKNDIETALNSVLPAEYEYSIFRIDYAGIVYGDRGYNFPA